MRNCNLGYPELYLLPDFVLERLGLCLRVNPATRRAVVYVGQNARGSFLPVGTGFCVGVPYRDQKFFFFVTADHVVDLVAGDTIFIRMNTKGGEAGEPIPVTKSSRVQGIDRQLDLAIFPVPPLHDFYDADYIYLDRGEYQQIMEEVWRPTLGDEVATVGLYTSHHGHTKNIPVVRVGHIAMLPDEPVMSSRGYAQAYLIEVRSIVGLSGSPVYITIPPFRINDGRIELLDTPGGETGAVCIGMMLGYHLSATAEDEIVVPQQQAQQPQPVDSPEDDEPDGGLSLDERNTGFGVVLPIERLFDVMESEAMRRAMDRAIDSPQGPARTRVRPAGAPPVPDGELSPQPTDANPNHRGDFMRLVSVAGQKRELKD